MAASTTVAGLPMTERIPDGQVSHEHGNPAHTGDKPNITDLPRPDTSPMEKVACDRCRRRKIKCDRIHPCNQCSRSQSQCSYPMSQKRAKRQRVLISSIYESRIEHISGKIDHLARLMEGLNNPIQKGPSTSARNVSDNGACTAEKNIRSQLATAEDQSIDNSLFSYVTSAVKFLEEAVGFDGNKRTLRNAPEMRSAFETLKAVVDSQRLRNVAGENVAPFPGAFPLSSTRGDLPVPSIDKVMACLIMAQDHPAMPMYWLEELKSLGDFTLHVMRVCSPGHVPDSELIIAYAGLYWLFTECATVASDEMVHDFNEQAKLCRDALESILSSLGLHIPLTIDYVLAMYLATLYCFQKGKVFACWTFISKASLHAQALGFHSSAAMVGDTVEARQRKMHLFWSIYHIEKGISLRLARPSTIRDNDITIPRPEPQPSTSTTVPQILFDSVNAARIYGLIYDEIYSPRVLAQLSGTPIARVYALAAEWQEVSARKAEHLMALARRMKGLQNSEVLEFIRHANQVSDSMVLLAIYRAIPGQTPVLMATECISTARNALQGHTECIIWLFNYESRSAQLEFWINGGFLLLPFIPFHVVFCNIVETGNPDDLNILEALVQAMKALSEKADYANSARQLGIFRALYDIAAIYVAFKRETYLASQQDDTESTSSENPHNMGNLDGGVDVLSAHQLPQSQSWAHLGGMELDPLGTQLGSWFQESNDAMDFLGGL